MQKKAFTLAEVAIVLGLVLVLAAILLPVIAKRRHHHTGDRAQCQSNLRQLGLGIAQYLQDYNAKYPPVGSEKFGWSNAIQPYFRTRQFYFCPASDSDRQAGNVDYFYNALLQKMSMVKIARPNFTITLGDGLADSPANDSIKDLPDAWRKDPQSPSFRHLEGANYLFADLHVKWYKPEEITNGSPLRGQPAFRLQ